jgi:ABC-type multidrug transport system fused ATPase/permease subunit
MEANNQMLGRLEDTQSTLRGRVKHRTLFSVVSHLFLNIGFSLGYLIAFLWGLLRMHAGSLTFGGMTAFLQLVYRIQGPARDLTKLAPEFVNVFTSAERLMELEEIPEEEQGETLMMKGTCGIHFDHVSYWYDKDQLPTIHDASYQFAPATCTAIVGETGSGKTTVIRLLLSLIKPQQGSITIYTNDEEQQLSPRHRCNFVYVPQGNTMLSGTLRDNLRIGAPEATDEQMMEALHTACANFIDELPNGLDTTFAERGSGLSEGQAQRIAIARALLRPGSIILLDEATSALDAETECQLLENLMHRKQNTIICVTHRPAVIDYCDQVIRIT